MTAASVTTTVITIVSILLFFMAREIQAPCQDVCSSRDAARQRRASATARCPALRPRLGAGAIRSFFTVPVAQIDPLPEAGRRQHQHVGHHKHPVAEQPAVDDEAGGRRKLPDEKPPRQALRAALAPLSVDLAAYRRQQDGSRRPSYDLSPHGVFLAGSLPPAQQRRPYGPIEKRILVANRVAGCPRALSTSMPVSRSAPASWRQSP